MKAFRIWQDNVQVSIGRSENLFVFLTIRRKTISRSLFHQRIRRFVSFLSACRHQQDLISERICSAHAAQDCQLTQSILPPVAGPVCVHADQHGGAGGHHQAGGRGPVCAGRLEPRHPPVDQHVRHQLNKRSVSILKPPTTPNDDLTIFKNAFPVCVKISPLPQTG